MKRGDHIGQIQQVLRAFLRENVQPAVDTAFNKIASGTHVLYQALPLPKTGTSGHVGAVQPDQNTIVLDPTTGIISAGSSTSGASTGGLPTPKWKGSILRSNVTSAGVLYWEEYGILGGTSGGSGTGSGSFGKGISTQVASFAVQLAADAAASSLGISQAVFAVWAQRETGGSVVGNNPLNVANNQTDPNLYDNGMTMSRTGPFAQFDSQSDGCLALVAELVNGPNWAGIRTAAAGSGNNDAAVIAAIQASIWDTGHYPPAGSLWSDYQTWITGGSGGTGAATDVANFVTEWTGSTCWNGGNDQCVALANQYMDEILGTPDTTDSSWGGVGYAYQMFTKAPSAHWTAIAYTSGASPSSGDLVIWLSSLAGSGGAGHVALCVSATSSLMQTFDQNFPDTFNGEKSDCEPNQHDYTSVLGWIRYTG